MIHLYVLFVNLLCIIHLCVLSLNIAYTFVYFDDDGELIYPYIEDGVNKGLYDARELDGTCTIGFCPDDMSIAPKAEMAEEGD